MAEVELRGITKRFGNITALDTVSFEIKDGEFFVLLGPTGAGKTTSLRVIAGLEKQGSGNILFNGQVADALTPADRDVAFVFQQYSLYPTMTVYDNLAFPLRSPLRKTPEPEIKTLVGSTAEKLRITHLLTRKTGHLSGGEMQRVSIGRAIVRSPQVFLMDEPLSNLDAKLRETLRVELKHIQKTEHSTTLFVTHDQVEALTMADRIAVLREGQVVQVGTPHDIYNRPSNTFVAQLVGSPRINLFKADIVSGSLVVPQTPIRLPVNNQLADQILVGLRPEDLVLHAQGEFKGEVALVEPLGVETVVHIQTGTQTLVCVIAGLTHYQRGSTIQFNINCEQLHFFDLAGQRIG